MNPLTNRLHTPQDGTVTLPPDTDLGAMVEAILREAGYPAAVQGGFLVRLSIIHDTAQRLKLALKREQGVMEEMGDALKRIRLRVEPGRSGAWTLEDACREVGWIDDECRLRLANYKAAHRVP